MCTTRYCTHGIRYLRLYGPSRVELSCRLELRYSDPYVHAGSFAGNFLNYTYYSPEGSGGPEVQKRLWAMFPMHAIAWYVF
jgi:hypothetical protein